MNIVFFGGKEFNGNRKDFINFMIIATISTLLFFVLLFTLLQLFLDFQDTYNIVNFISLGVTFGTLYQYVSSYNKRLIAVGYSKGFRIAIIVLAFIPILSIFSLIALFRADNAIA